MRCRRVGMWAELPAGVVMTAWQEVRSSVSWKLKCGVLCAGATRRCRTWRFFSSSFSIRLLLASLSFSSAWALCAYCVLRKRRSLFSCSS